MSAQHTATMVAEDSQHRAELAAEKDQGESFAHTVVQRNLEIAQYEELLRTERETSSLLLKDMVDERERLQTQIAELEHAAQDARGDHKREIKKLQTSLIQLRSEFAVELTRAKHEAVVQSERARLLSDERRRLLQRLSRHVVGGVPMSKEDFQSLVSPTPVT